MKKNPGIIKTLGGIYRDANRPIGIVHEEFGNDASRAKFMAEMRAKYPGVKFKKFKTRNKLTGLTYHVKFRVPKRGKKKDFKWLSDEMDL